ncbi:MAG TPA: O-antigen ligase family protein [Pirellulales bacterium]|jgi:O-antigen ligase|nr:O-antigen ligase family protein [Pirellulales bacterium]
MEFLIIIAGVCGLVWATWFILRGSLVGGCLGLILIANVFGYWFWHNDGGIPVTVDRALLVLLFVAYGLRKRFGATEPKPLIRADCVLFALLVVLTFSTFTHDWSFEKGEPLTHLVIYWIIPGSIYWIARQSPLSEQNIRGIFIALALFGAYLTVTGLLEALGQWSLVFPQYIASPKHQYFGRVRGPFLNPVAMGIYLATAIAAALMLWPRLGRFGQLSLLLFSSIAGAAFLATLTRSVWLGGALASAIFLALITPRPWRFLLFGVGSVLLAAVFMMKTDSIWNIKRDENLGAAAAAESAELRPILANVAWNMFQDRPLLGFGFGQYDRERLPYLADRSSELPLDKSRPYVQHNAFLALLTDTGLAGTSLFALLLILWISNARKLWTNPSAPLVFRQVGLVFMVIMGVYLPNAMFHDTSIIDGLNLLIFFMAGLTSGLVAKIADHTSANEPGVQNRRFQLAC